MKEKLHILIVDDDQKFRKTLSDILTVEGYAPIAVSREKTALKKVEKEKPAVALIDLKLEESSGLEVMKGIKELSPETECIILTGYASEETAIEAVNLGAFYYLQKPYDMDQLLMILQRAVEKWKAGEALIESEEKYRNVVDNASVGIVIGQDGMLKFFNPVISEMLGYSDEELLSKPFSELVLHPDDKERAYETHYKRIKGEKVPQFTTYKIIDKKGNIKWVEINGITITWDERPAALNFIIDITERKQVEEELLRSEEKYRLIADNVPVGIFIQVGGKIKYCGKETARLLGYDGPEEIVEKDLIEFVCEDDRGYVLDRAKKIAAGEELPTGYEIKLIKKRGETIPVLVYGNTINYLGEKARQGVFIDISERKRVEKERENLLVQFKDSEERYRNLVENINDVIFNIDMEGNFTYISPLIEKLFGYKPEEIVNKSYIKYIYPDDLNGLLKSFEQTVTGELEPYEFRVLKKDGELRHVRTSSRVQFEEDVPVGITGVMTDITEKKQAVEELINREKFLDSIIDQSPFATWISDAEGTLKRANPALKRLLNLTDEQLVGKYNVLEDKIVEREGLQPLVRTVFDEGKTISFTLEWDGSDMPNMDLKGSKSIICEGTMFPIYNPGGELTNVVLNWIDITEQKLVEEALKDSEELYRNLVENLNDVIYTLDLEGNITYVSPIAERLSGYKPEEFLNQPFTKYIHPDDLPGLTNSLEHTMAGEIEPYEYRFAVKDGTYRHVLSSSQVIFEKDQPVGLVCVMKDITDRKIAEEKIRKESEKAQQYLDIVEVMLVALNSKGEITLINRKGNSIFGYEEGELIGKNWFDTCVPKDVKKKVYSVFKKLIVGETEQLEYFENSIITKSGEERIVAWHNTILRDREDNAIGTLGSGEDITDRKRAEDTLKESQAKLAEAMRIAHIGSWNIDYNTDSTYYWSDEVYRIFNQTPETFTPDINNTLKFVHPDDKEFVINIMIEAIENRRKKFSYEYRIINPDGTIRYVTSFGNLVYDQKGTPLRVFGILQDITERKMMETQLIQSEKLSSLGGILSGVAHELNNPLTAIIGNAQLLARKDISSEIKDKLEVIQKESIRCTKIVGGLLAFAREHKPERKIISVNDVIMESYKLREYEFKVDNIDIELNLSMDIPGTSADPYQLQQVFINLINNAYDALKEKSGGILNIRSYRKDKTIVIEFNDNGPGIPKENINKIFDPFFTTKDVGEGTGLGLSIIYGIVNEHGGKIYVESKIDKGTKFTVEIPILKEAVEIDKVKIESPKKSERTRSVLVVEDEESMRDLMLEVLSSEGYVVDTANRGEKAIELLKKFEYDVIISDMKMPGISGQNLYALVQKEYPELTDRMLFITGDVLGKETQNFFKITGVKFIEKPFEIDELLHKLSDLLSD